MQTDFGLFPVFETGGYEWFQGKPLLFLFTRAGFRESPANFRRSIYPQQAELLSRMRKTMKRRHPDAAETDKPQSRVSQ